MKHTFWVLVVFGGFLNCASTLPREQREVITVLEVKGTKKVLYSKALEYLAKNQGNSLLAIQIKDEERGKIVTKGNINCSSLNGMRYGVSSAQNIDFVLDVTVKDNKARIIFEDIIHKSKSSTGGDIDQGPSSAEQIQDIKQQCLQPIEKGISDYLSGKGGGRGDDF